MRWLPNWLTEGWTKKPGAMVMAPGTPLAAVYLGQIRVLQKYIAAGQAVDQTDEYGRTLLITAATLIDVFEGFPRRLEAARLLLDAGADVNKQDVNGWTALHFAADRQDVAMARLLLGHGARLDLRDNWGNAPLSTATFNSRGRGEMINLLLEAGADPDAENNYGVSPRKLADTIANYDVKQFFT